MEAVATYNGPLEAGVRAVAVLGAAYPQSFDLHQLIALDYLLVRTAEFGGPENLHPSAPIQVPATEVRRKVVHDALLLMMTKDLVRRQTHADGIRYAAGEAAAMFLDALQCDYLTELKARAAWIVDYLSENTGSDLDSLMRRFFDDWVEEFQAVERSLGADT